jgi:methionine synthase I (cobalamin-dependent)
MLELLGPFTEAATGIDLSRQMLALARAWLSAAGLAHCALCQADMARLSFGPASFDFVALPMVLHDADDTLEAALIVQAEGLVAGEADAILIETCQDTLPIKAAVNGAKIACGRAGKDDLPVFVQVTVETVGTLLVGPDSSVAAAVIHALDVPLMGLNCARARRRWPSMCAGWRRTGLAR